MCLSHNIFLCNGVLFHLTLLIKKDNFVIDILYHFTLNDCRSTYLSQAFLLLMIYVFIYFQLLTRMQNECWIYYSVYMTQPIVVSAISGFMLLDLWFNLYKLLRRKPFFIKAMITMSIFLSTAHECTIWSQSCV